VKYIGHISFAEPIYFLPRARKTHSPAASISEEKYNMEPGMNHGEQVLKDVPFDTVAAPW
jgi:hypothetical protein